MNKFKKGDRVRNTGFNPELATPKLNWEGTIDGHSDLPNCIYVCWDNYPEERDQINKRFLTLINSHMNDTDKIELTVADVKAAHAKGCSTGKAMVEAMFPKVFEKEKGIYRTGQLFNHLGDKYILAQVNDSEMCLISLSDGNRWESPVKVKSSLSITKEEFNRICDGDTDEFNLIS